MDDETLLKTVTLPYLRSLCAQHSISRTGTKVELLQRLRSHASNVASIDAARKKESIERRKEAVRTGGTATEKHRLIEGEEEEEEEDELESEGSFYYLLPTSPSADAEARQRTRKERPPAPAGYPASNPPPPPERIRPNADGERIVAIYDSTDRNDLTGCDAGPLPGRSVNTGNEAMMGGHSRLSSAADDPSRGLAGGPFGDVSGSKRKRRSTEESERAREVLEELVGGLLAGTGAPGFADEYDEIDVVDDDVERSDDAGGGLTSRAKETSAAHQREFTGFDPASVPLALLSESSRALRCGDVLQEVLSEYELTAIGRDGTAGDDVSNGGGHYREVSKVRAFLEGYANAERKRIARETTTMLLDVLVREGVKGLDVTLASMTRGGGGDDGSAAGEAGELNDDLVRYLEDAAREQEQKVERLVGSGGETEEKEISAAMREDEKGGIDDVSELWNVTNEDGENVEVIDPSDPAVREALKDELSLPPSAEADNERPRTAPEKLLLLLSSLRDRIKAEALVFADEVDENKGRNLRILAHCLHASGSSEEREGIIANEFGSSLDRLDSFVDLVTSSIEYAESASNELLRPSPSRSTMKALDVPLLRAVRRCAEAVRERRARRASGVTIDDDKRGGGASPSSSFKLP